MIFNQSQIQDMLSILRRYELIFIANQLGMGYLSQADKNILLASGIDLDKFKNNSGIVEHAFLFGLLAEAIGDNRAKKMSYAQFQRFLASGNFIPLTEEEEFALQTVKNRAYTDITNLGNRMRNSLSNVALKNNQEQSLMVQNMIKQKTIKAIELRAGARSLASNLADASKDWEVDWLRIAYYLTHEAYNSGRAQSILKQYGADSEVYFDVYPGACKKCRELYLTDPEDPDSEPKIFELKTIIANGNNIGRKVADWKPTISPTHPYCRCTINHKRKGFAWDSELRAYTIPEKRKSSNPKLKGVKLNIKVSKAQEDELNRKRALFKKRLSDAKKDTDKKPSESQIKAGNYKKGHISFDGHTYVIENPKGSYRRGVDENGNKWCVQMNNTYGYFLGTLGKDKDHIDVFINDDADLDKFNGDVYIVDQVNDKGEFDEHKIMYGFDSLSEAKKAYLSNYSKGWKGCGAITGISKDKFNKWINSSKRKIKPFSNSLE